MSEWNLTYDEFDARQEALREALCTLCNGYFATRGAAPESRADGVHYPGTYVAGCFNRLETEIAGQTVENESLVNAPNWLELTFRIEGGDWFDLREVEILSFRQDLDQKRAILSREVRFRDTAGRHTRLEQRRLVSMERMHLAALETVLEAEDWSGEIEVRSALDGTVTNAGVERYSDLESRHLEPLTAGSLDDDTMLLETLTNQSHIRIALAATTCFWSGEERVGIAPRVDRDRDYVAHRYRLGLESGKPLRIEKIAALYTSRDSAISSASRWYSARSRFYFVYALHMTDRLRTSTFVQGLLILLVALGFGAFWEIVEYVVVQFFARGAQGSPIMAPLDDTMWDLILDGLGGALGALIGPLYIKYSQRSHCRVAAFAKLAPEDAYDA